MLMLVIGRHVVRIGSLFALLSASGSLGSKESVSGFSRSSFGATVGQADTAPAQARRLPLGLRSAGRHQSLRRGAQRQRPEALHLARRPRHHHRRPTPRVPSVGINPLALGSTPLAAVLHP